MKMTKREAIELLCIMIYALVPIVAVLLKRL